MDSSKTDCAFMSPPGNDDFDRYPYPWLVCETNGTICRANRAANLRFALPGDTLTGELIDRWIAMSDRTALRSLMTAAMIQGAADGRISLVTPDGNVGALPMLLWRQSAEATDRLHLQVIGEGYPRPILETGVIQEELTLFRTMAEMVPSLLVVVDRNGKPIYVSPNCLEFSGYTQEEIARGVQFWADSEEFAEGDRLFREALVQGIGIDGYEYQFLRKDGDVRQVSCSARPIKDATGAIQTVLIQIIDVHDRYHENLLRQHEAKKYRDLVESISDMVWETDTEGKIVYASGRMREVFGYDIDEVRGKAPFEFMPPDEAYRMQARIGAQVARHEPVLHVECRSITKAGAEVFFELNGQPLFDLDGNYRGYRTIGHNITPRKTMERALMASEARFRMLFDDLHIGIVLIDADQGKPAFMNRAVYRMFGYNYPLTGHEGGFVPHPPELILDEEIRQAIREHRASSLEWERELTRIDGQSFWTSIHIHQIYRPEAGIHWIVASIHDISAVKRIERQLQSSLQEKDILLRELNHRVKNNLEIISSLLYLQSEKTDDPGIRQLFGECLGRIECISWLHDRMNRVGNLGALRLDELLRDIAMTVCENYDSSREWKHIDLDLCEAQIDVKLAFPAALIANELITNSLKHAFPKDRLGTIIINLEQVDENTWKMTIADDGVGYDPDAPQAAGSFGLQLVKMLVAQVHGRWETKIESGVQHTLWLPLRKHHEKTPSTNR